MQSLNSQRLRVWFDPEGDFLEVLFSDAPGYMRETDSDQVSLLSRSKALTVKLFPVSN